MPVFFMLSIIDSRLLHMTSSDLPPFLTFSSLRMRYAVGMECVKASCFSSGTKMAVGGATDLELKGEMDAAIVSNMNIVGGKNLVNLSK